MNINTMQHKNIFLSLIFSLILLLIGCHSFFVGEDTFSSREGGDDSITKSEDRSRFYGESLILIGSNVKNKQIATDKQTCLDPADEKISKILADSRLKGSTQYFEVTSLAEVNLEDWKILKERHPSVKFIFEINSNDFLQITPKVLKELDKNLGYMDSSELYILRNRSASYLIMIGHESATSGMGHNLRHHFLLPLGSDAPVIEFESVSDDPKRVGISDSGMVYYTKIDPPYYGALRQNETEKLSLKVSLFTVENGNRKNVGTAFEQDCPDINTIFVDLNDQ